MVIYGHPAACVKNLVRFNTDISKFRWKELLKEKCQLSLFYF